MPETRTPDTEYDQQHRITEQVYDRILTGTGPEFRTGAWSLHDGTIQIPTTNGSVHVTAVALWHGDHLRYTHHHGDHAQVLLDMPTDFGDAEVMVRDGRLGLALLTQR